MKYQVPQFIDIEDKIAFQLTAKQLGWFAAGGVLLFIIWNFVSFGFFVFWGVVIIGTSAGLAFIKIGDLTLIDYIGHGLGFTLKPKIFIWRKTLGSGGVGLRDTDNKKAKENKKLKPKKKKDIDIEEIASILDSQ